MALKRMLVDAAHPEETRVAIMDGNHLEEFDVESSSRRLLKGNIYLAKVTRVEPSLQAAFVDYGGNRHGFLSFNEIHPDYYQIPVSDRERLLAEENESLEGEDNEAASDEETEGEGNGNGQSDKNVETIGGDDIDEAEVEMRARPVRRYKIQEVIKRRQILLVQVVKEERGNKGAALTTYLSLAGRYCVLMPNTGKGGGISRKIGSGQDRKRLKSIISGLDIAAGMAVIVRTAGADRSKAEIKRDYDYLIKLWNDIRNLTLESTAPALIHEEANIIKRSIRDLYSRDIDEILIEGENGYRTAKDLMKMLVPSHARKVQPYTDSIVSLFSRYHIESQLEAMNHQEVQLKSGGYIVINSTEALVAIDVNSGRATRGRNIEETALRTNTEAATEIARHLRLRDLAGLVVIDFIDMEVHRNQTNVERRLKEAMRRDRARIQIGRISPFGLLELSRQRLRPSITETIADVCPHCGGTGIRRSTESAALHVLRAIEEEGVRKRAQELDVSIHPELALYILNHKRVALGDIEQKFEFRVFITEDESLIPPNYVIKRTIDRAGEDGAEERVDADADRPEDDKKRKRRRSRSRKRSDDATDAEVQQDAEIEIAAAESSETAESAETGDEDDEKPPARRRRGRRGGRRRGRGSDTDAAAKTSDEGGKQQAKSSEKDDAKRAASDAPAADKISEDKPKRRRRVRKKAAKADSGKDAVATEAQASDQPDVQARDQESESVTATETPAEPPENEPTKQAVPESMPEPEPEDEPEAEEKPAAASVSGDDQTGDAVVPSVPEDNPAYPGSNSTIVGPSEDGGEPSDESRRGWWQRLME
ncbi:MAG: ribonuclease E/G [Rhodospirillaceae bacterium]|jgi:ribonuclease E|nr:ribonuclease E/G [Rhodospirillaceae bacterium]MDP6646072.1 Rne/Rng family ribonuclease [Rhodospirillales bacterium]|tara:strand:+ start:894 stop:3362 length:2469 start_codon:yes stop_codon:yes gene_type:complete